MSIIYPLISYHFLMRIFTQTRAQQPFTSIPSSNYSFTTLPHEAYPDLYPYINVPRSYSRLMPITLLSPKIFHIATSRFGRPDPDTTAIREDPCTFRKSDGGDGLSPCGMARERSGSRQHRVPRDCRSYRYRSTEIAQELQDGVWQGTNSHQSTPRTRGRERTLGGAKTQGRSIFPF